MKDSPNIDFNEVNKFSQLALSWWDPTGPFKPLHQINPLRLQVIQSKVCLSEKNVLDIGCGGGILTESLKRAGANVMGLDLSEAAIAKAQEHALASGLTIDYQACDIESLLPQYLGHFDVITCMELLEHVPNPALMIANCALLLKKGGHLFFSTLNRNFKSFGLAILGAEYLLNLLPRGTHEYAKFITPSELANWCRCAKLEPIETMGIGYKPFAKQFYLTPQVDVNYMLYATR